MFFTLISLILFQLWINPIVGVNPGIAETKWGNKYDFVVIGGGTAGLILTSRLAEVKRWKILVLEAGEEPPYFSLFPLAAPSMLISKANWKYMSEPDESNFKGFVQNQIFMPSGKGLGGSSSINYMIYTRGNMADYEKLSNLGWGYKDVLPYFLKSEMSHLPYYDSEFHNMTGFMNIQYGYNGEEVADFLKAAKQLGYNMTDYNGENQLGFSSIQAYLDRGARESSYTATLKRSLPPNVEVVTDAFVTKIIFDKSGTQVKSVKFIKNNRRYRAQASKEYLLCAGTFNSPKILLQSGVGPSQQLKKHKIPIVKNLTNVGENFGDHIAYLGLNFFGLYNRTQLDMTKDTFSDMTTWFLTGDGIPTSLGGFESIGFIKLPSSPENQKYPDIQLLFQNTMINPAIAKITNMKLETIRKLYDDTKDKIQFSIVPILLHLKSRGRIEIQSKNPDDPPLIYPNYLQHSDDEAKLIEGIKLVLNFMKTKVYKNLDVKLNPNAIPGCEDKKQGSDDYWKCAVRVLTSTAYDYFGTCQMGSEIDPQAVVTPKLKLQGVHNLRVVDASVIPNTISGNLQAVVVMIAERAADFIKNDRLKRLITS